MAKLIWPVLVLAGAALLATAPLTVSGTFDIFSVLSTVLNATSNSTNNTDPVVFNASLNNLAALMNGFKPLVLVFYNKTFVSNTSQPNTTGLTALELPKSLALLAFTQVLPIVNQLAANVGTILGSQMMNVTMPPANFSVLDFINKTATMFNVSLDTALMQISFNSTPNATVPGVFGANLNQTAMLVLQFLPVINATVAPLNGTSLGKSIIGAVGFALPIVNNILKQIQPLLTTVTVPKNLTEVLDGLLGLLNSSTTVVKQFLPTNLTLVRTDPDWDYTCGTFFTDNLNKMSELWNQTNSAVMGVLKSTMAQNLTVVSGTIRSIAVVMPILTNLTGQVGAILDGMTPKYNRRLYPSQVRTNRHKSDCHLRHLQRVNARRFG
ncbi:uncharacterized protein LOC119771202 [Culex quinquefasciatus]|uniref:uncharacterized protein LOC119771202 n=1 Tax=Culex quinquefasciatus TaxID=7176 RepID=UPI0018E3CDAB|nr:uncharacterized protein LOC119771202 [Culex quinquefasciatus]